VMPDETVIDGEVVALDEAGRPSFNLLQNYGSAGAPLIYYVFDVLFVSGRNVMSEPLVRRKEILRHEVLAQLGEPIRESPVLDASLRDLMTAVRAQGLEGLVAKRLESAYEPGKRSGAWQKMRLNQGREFVIGGYTPSPKNFDALIFGYYEGSNLVYAARTRKWLHAGITGATVPEIPRAGDLSVPVCEPSRSTARPVGPRAHGRKNAGVPMATPPVGGQLRIRGVDS
jgi:ATP-dependent DNA ligase